MTPELVMLVAVVGLVFSGFMGESKQEGQVVEDLPVYLTLLKVRSLIKLSLW